MKMSMKTLFDSIHWLLLMTNESYQIDFSLEFLLVTFSNHQMLPNGFFIGCFIGAI